MLSKSTRLTKWLTPLVWASFTIITAVASLAHTYIGTDAFRVSIDAPYMLAAIFLIFLWYRVDSEGRGFARTPLLNAAVIAANPLGLTYYFFRSRGLVRGALAVGGCLALFTANVVVVAAVEYFVFGARTMVEIEQQLQPIDGVASYRKFSPPHYPLEMVRNNVQGKVVLKVLIGTTGRPESVSVETSSGHQQLDDAAVNATWNSEFVPAERDGRPVSSFALVPLDFKLEDMH